MKLLDISLNNLLRKKGRTFFLVSGLAIGIGAAVAMTSVGDAMNREVMHALDEFGANILVLPAAEGLPLSYGGPYLGLFATKREHLRQMPGRIAGVAHDAQGRRGYVMTLQAREQHIRRERATSNICSNQMLCALAATVYLALMGPLGFRTVSEQNFAVAHHLSDRLLELPGCSPRYQQPFFNEFVLTLPAAAEDVERELWDDGIVSGLPLSRWWPERRNEMLFCGTEVITEAAINRLLAAMEEALR